jgi:hypothetical protein
MSDIDKEHARPDKYIPTEILNRLPTAEELAKIRQLIEQDARTRWFWSSLRTWVLAISSVLALFTIGFDGLRTILRRLVA